MRPAPRSIVVLTGAGISAESGIETFRAADGLWAGHPVDEVATPEGFARDPGRVHDFYNRRRRRLLSDEVEPNAAHRTLAAFERDFDGEFLLVTQNIDDLHERAGSAEMAHMHGELLKMRCARTGRVFGVRDDIGPETPCPCCGAPGRLRPHVVWFGETPFQMERILDALDRCDLFVSIGTSGNVYPAAGFHRAAKAVRARTVELNLERTGSVFDAHMYGPATRTVPEFLDGLIP